MRYPNDPTTAVAEIEPRREFQIYIFNTWLQDEDVRNYMHELHMKSGVISLVPTKEEFAADLYREARECRSKDLKLDYMKLLADVMGFVTKGTSNVINNNNLVDNRSVMVVPQIPENVTDIDAWEKMAMEQQVKLVNEH